MIWPPEFQQDLWRRGQRSLYELFENSTYAQIAPYVVYSASFGSEPIGDWVDGDDFVKDLTLFRTTVSVRSSVPSACTYRIGRADEFLRRARRNL